MIHFWKKSFKLKMGQRMGYVLDSQLAADSFAVEALTLCELRLCNNQNICWLILIPKKENMTELLDLSGADQAQLWTEINHIATLLKTHFPCDKLNIAMLGNVVSQLHVHVIARRFDDAYFPRAPFGLEGLSYSVEAAETMIKKIKALL